MIEIILKLKGDKEMKIILIILSIMLSVISFSTEKADDSSKNIPTIDKTVASKIANKELIQNIMGNIGKDSENIDKMNEIGEQVDTEIQKEKPNWEKVETLYNELSTYTNKLALETIKTLKENGMDKNEADFENDIANDLVSDTGLEEVLPKSIDEKEVVEAIKKGMTDSDLERMEYLSSKITKEIDKTKPNWTEVEKDYNELSRYTNKVTVILMKEGKEKNKAD